ncbi:hypothetical protein [Nocardioides bizhenqiangii]|uniref:XRE family transcriptional regulator n=1 Tax=Nocardioides bizhenqiangii TaxID=3095076 RepID=A0ABZ0ZST5_9ACTN|nr:hypothetical protein [Nocardioides sp. HM61]WQQ26717.1 hypothetical protein SHK19_00455 [Nocardioides sp. HM61]
MKTPEPGESDDFAVALRAAIAARQVSLVWLRDRLTDRGNPVSLTTLSYWRSGHRHPEGAGSHAAIREIEELLGLPEDALASLIGPTRRVGPLAAPVPPFEARPVSEAAEETTAALRAPTGVFRELTTQVVADVDESGVLRRRWIRMVLQVTSGTVGEYPWVEIVEGYDGPPVFSDAAGARLTRTYDHPSGTAYGVVLELERPVTAPDTAVLEWVTDYPYDDVPTPECMHGRSRPGGDLLMWVRFHPDRLPTWWGEFTDADVAPVPRRTVGPGSTAHVFRRSFGPGVFGLRWGFEGRQE